MTHSNVQKIGVLGLAGIAFLMPYFLNQSWVDTLFLWTSHRVTTGMPVESPLPENARFFYRYTVSGQTFQQCATGEHFEKDDVRPGQLKVFYNPDNPKMASLTPPWESFIQKTLFVGIWPFIFPVLVVLKFTLGRKKRNRQFLEKPITGKKPVQMVLTQTLKTMSKRYRQIK